MYYILKINFDYLLFIIILFFVDEEFVVSKEKIIVRDIFNVFVFKSFYFKCSVYISRIYLYDEVCRLIWYYVKERVKKVLD